MNNKRLKERKLSEGVYVYDELPSGTYLFTCPNCGEKIQKGLSPETLEAIKNSSLFKESLKENKEFSDEETLKEKFKYAITFMGSYLSEKIDHCTKIAQEHTYSKLRELEKLNEILKKECRRIKIQRNNYEQQLISIHRKAIRQQASEEIKNDNSKQIL